MDEELKTTVNYILETYQEYIDTLQIAELKNQLLNDYHIDPWNFSRAIVGILQLIVNECGGDIVNDIYIDKNRGVIDYYNGVKFNQHVTIKKDHIQPFEFSAAKFFDGITVQSKKLPRGALKSAEMQGIVDLTGVEILDSDNLYYNAPTDCVIKLSKNLKEVDAGSFTVNTVNGNRLKIEYDGTKEEFNKLIEDNSSKWSNTAWKLNTFYSAMKWLTVKCTDGTWAYGTAGD